jgi:translation initiation factor 3 subunit C
LNAILERELKKYNKQYEDQINKCRERPWRWGIKNQRWEADEESKEEEGSDLEFRGDPSKIAMSDEEEDVDDW